MTQNVISLALSADQLAEVNKALDMLEKNLTELISLSVDDRSELRKMGPKSEMFARKAYDGKRRPNPVLTPQTLSLSRRSFTADKSNSPGSKSSPHQARMAWCSGWSGSRMASRQSA